VHRAAASLVPAALLAAVLAAGGCSGGGRTPTSSPSAASSRTAWRAGEVRPVTGLCDAVSAAVLRRLRVESRGFPCSWRQGARDTDDHVERTLEVGYMVYEPSQTRPGQSATDAARHDFRNPPRGWPRTDTGVPVRGLGEEAKLVHRFNPSIKQRRIVLSLRWRNVVLHVDADEQSPLEWNRGRVLPVGDVEAGAIDVARDILTRLGAPPARVGIVPPYMAGEVREVHEICDVAAAAAHRLAPGVTRHDIALTGEAAGSGCNWGENDGELPALTVDAEVIGPSPATGESATAIATTLFGQWKGRDGSHAPELGAEAKLDHFSFKTGLSRNSTLFVRQANLLVYVDYQRWQHPSKEAMDKEVIALAKAVLADQR
jgi:hypothetical protein